MKKIENYWLVTGKSLVSFEREVCRASSSSYLTSDAKTVALEQFEGEVALAKTIQRLETLVDDVSSGRKPVSSSRSDAKVLEPNEKQATVQSHSIRAHIDALTVPKKKPSRSSTFMIQQKYDFSESETSRRPSVPSSNQIKRRLVNLASEKRKASET